MEPIITDIDEVTKQIEINVPATEVEAKIKEELDKVAKRVTLKGFRKGKAPRAMVEKLYKGSAYYEVVDKLIGETLFNTIREQKLNYVGEPEVKMEDLEEGKDIVCKATVYLQPEPEITGYDKFDGIKFQDKMVVDDSKVEEAANNIVRNFAEHKDVTGRDTAQNGDVAKVELQITHEGEEPHKAEPATIRLGDARLVKEIDDGVVGMKIGEEKDIVNEHMHGEEKHTTTYHVKLLGLQEEILPELTDEFVAKMGDANLKTVADFKADIRKHLEINYKDMNESNENRAIIEFLSEKNQFKIPQLLIDNMIRYMLAEFRFVDPEKVDVRKIDVTQFRDHYGEEATRRLREQIIRRQVAKQEKIEPQMADYNYEVEKLAATHGVSAEEARKQLFSSHESITMFHEMVAGEMVMDFLRGKAGLEVKPRPEAKKEETTEEAPAE